MGDGFTKLHEFGMNERLTRQQRWSVGEEGAWKAVTHFIGRAAQRPVYGWTNGIRWRLSAGYDAFFQADLSRTETAIISRTRVQKGKHHRNFIEAYATSSDVLTKVFMFIEQIEQDMVSQNILGGKMDFIIGQFSAAREIIEAEHNTFSKWENSLSSEQRQDGLMKALIEKYKSEHEAKMQAQRDIVLRSLLTIGRIHGARFMSVSADDLICFEDVRTARLPFGKPVAWHIRDLLDLGGVGNGSQAQINLRRELPKAMFGTYFLFGADAYKDTPLRVAPHVPFRDANEDQIASMFSGRHQSQSAWLRDCGATGKSEW